MLERNRLTGAIGRGLLAAMTAGMLTGVAACGGVVAGQSSHPATAAGGGAASATVPLCANVAHLDRLVIVRGGIPQTHIREALPVGVVISDPAQVQAVAAALCGSPPVHTQGPCPAASAAAYRLGFSAAGRTFPPVMVQVTGCRSVYGLGPARTTPGSFLTLLHKELGAGHVGATGGPVMP